MGIVMQSNRLSIEEFKQVFCSLPDEHQCLIFLYENRDRLQYYHNAPETYDLIQRVYMKLNDPDIKYIAALLLRPILNKRMNLALVIGKIIDQIDSDPEDNFYSEQNDYDRRLGYSDTEKQIIETFIQNLKRSLNIIPKKQSKNNIIVNAPPSQKLSFRDRLNAIHYEGEIPAAFICPLSLDIMNDPVSLSSGQVFDRAELIKYVESRPENKPLPCPMSRLIIGRRECRDFVTCIPFKNLIEEFVSAKEREATLHNEAKQTNGFFGRTP